MPPRLGVFLAIVLWGISFVATKAALEELSPVCLIFSRFALGAALLVGILAFRGERLVPPRDAWGPLALMGFVGVFVHHLLQVHGLALTTAVRTGWFIGLIPIWSALLSAIFLSERIGGRKLAGLALGFAGAVVLVTHGKLSTKLLGMPSTRGDFLVLASTINWAAYTILGHATIRRLGPHRATAGVMFLGWVMLVPLFAATGGWREYSRLSAVGVGAVLFLGFGCSGLGYLFWYGALEKVEASRVAAFLYLEPLVTLAAAALLLGEPIRAADVAGGLLVLAGVALVQRAPRGTTRASEPPPPAEPES
jgi:drug/metabolite transporter (DMT)-like permease